MCLGFPGLVTTHSLTFDLCGLMAASRRTPISAPSHVWFPTSHTTNGIFEDTRILTKQVTSTNYYGFEKAVTIVEDVAKSHRQHFPRNDVEEMRQTSTKAAFEAIQLLHDNQKHATRCRRLHRKDKYTTLSRCLYLIVQYVIRVHFSKTLSPYFPPIS
jgi:hypothetical protein